MASNQHQREQSRKEEKKQYAIQRKIESFCNCKSNSVFDNSRNPTRNEVGFKITSYILVLLTKTYKKLSSSESSYNCMKI